MKTLIAIVVLGLLVALTYMLGHSSPEVRVIILSLVVWLSK